MLHLVFWWILTDVTEELTVSIIRVMTPNDGGSKLLRNVGEYLSD
jgi:hypothetical protein